MYLHPIGFRVDSVVALLGTFRKSNAVATPVHPVATPPQQPCLFPLGLLARIPSCRIQNPCASRFPINVRSPPCFSSPPKRNPSSFLLTAPVQACSIHSSPLSPMLSPRITSPPCAINSPTWNAKAAPPISPPF